MTQDKKDQNPKKLTLDTETTRELIPAKPPEPAAIQTTTLSNVDCDTETKSLPTDR